MKLKFLRRWFQISQRIDSDLSHILQAPTGTWHSTSRRRNRQLCGTSTPIWPWTTIPTPAPSPRGRPTSDGGRFEKIIFPRFFFSFWQILRSALVILQRWKKFQFLFSWKRRENEINDSLCLLLVRKIICTFKNFLQKFLFAEMDQNNRTNFEKCNSFDGQLFNNTKVVLKCPQNGVLGHKVKHQPVWDNAQNISFF